MQLKLFLFFLCFLISFNTYADKVLKVSKTYQVRFSTKGLKDIKIGSIVKFIDGKHLTGEGKVLKFTKKTGYASIYKGKGKVKKGDKVQILEEFTGANKKTYVKRKFSLLAGIGTLSLGSLLSGPVDSPTKIDSFFGYQVEANYRFNNKFSVFVGVNKHGSSKSVTIPAGTFVSNLTDAAIVNGEISDIYVAGQYYFQRYPFVNSYLGLGFIPSTSFKVSVTSSGTTYEHVYTGSGILIRAGREFVFKGNWMFSLNVDFRSYSISGREDHNDDAVLEMDASLTSFSPSIMFGHNF